MCCFSSCVGLLSFAVLERFIILLLYWPPSLSLHRHNFRTHNQKFEMKRKKKNSEFWSENHKQHSYRKNVTINQRAKKKKQQNNTTTYSNNKQIWHIETSAVVNIVYKMYSLDCVFSSYSFYFFSLAGAIHNMIWIVWYRCAKHELMTRKGWREHLLLSLLLYCQRFIWIFLFLVHCCCSFVILVVLYLCMRISTV